MVILTNGFEEVQHIKVDNSGLSGFFSEVYTSDFLRKAQRNLELAAEAADIPMDGGIVMIGDSIESDVDGAQNVGGMRCISTSRPHFRHGIPSGTYASSWICP